MLKLNKRVVLLGLGLVIFALLLWKLDVRQSWGKISEANPKYLVLGIAFMGLTQLAGFLKWKIMHRVSMKEEQPLLPIYASVVVGGMVTPARSGEMIASLAWAKMQGKILAWALVSRILEGALTLVLSFFVLGVFFKANFSQFQWPAVALCAVIIVALIWIIFHRATGLGIFHVFRNLLVKIRALPFIEKLLSFEQKAEEQLEKFYDTTGIFKQKHVMVALIGTTLLSRFFLVLANLFLLASLGLMLSWMSVLGILAVTWVSGFFAPTPNGIGLGDIAPSLLMSYMGYQEFAGGYIVMNRSIEMLILFVWACIWFSVTRSNRRG